MTAELPSRRWLTHRALLTQIEGREITNATGLRELIEWLNTEPLYEIDIDQLFRTVVVGGNATLYINCDPSISISNTIADFLRDMNIHEVPLRPEDLFSTYVQKCWEHMFGRPRQIDDGTTISISMFYTDIVRHRCYDGESTLRDVQRGSLAFATEIAAYIYLRTRERRLYPLWFTKTDRDSNWVLIHADTMIDEGKTYLLAFGGEDESQNVQRSLRHVQSVRVRMAKEDSKNTIAWVISSESYIRGSKWENFEVHASTSYSASTSAASAPLYKILPEEPFRSFDNKQHLTTKPTMFIVHNDIINCLTQTIRTYNYSSVEQRDIYPIEWRVSGDGSCFYYSFCWSLVLQSILHGEKKYLMRCRRFLNRYALYNSTTTARLFDVINSDEFNDIKRVCITYVDKIMNDIQIGTHDRMLTDTMMKKFVHMSVSNEIHNMALLCRLAFANAMKDMREYKIFTYAYEEKVDELYKDDIIDASKYMVDLVGVYGLMSGVGTRTLLRLETGGHMEEPYGSFDGYIFVHFVLSDRHYNVLISTVRSLIQDTYIEDRNSDIISRLRSYLDPASPPISRAAPHGHSSGPTVAAPSSTTRRPIMNMIRTFTSGVKQLFRPDMKYMKFHDETGRSLTMSSGDGDSTKRSTTTSPTRRQLTRQPIEGIGAGASHLRSTVKHVESTGSRAAPTTASMREPAVAPRPIASFGGYVHPMIEPTEPSRIRVTSTEPPQTRTYMTYSSSPPRSVYAFSPSIARREAFYETQTHAVRSHTDREKMESSGRPAWVDPSVLALEDARARMESSKRPAWVDPSVRALEEDRKKIERRERPAWVDPSVLALEEDRKKIERRERPAWVDPSVLALEQARETMRATTRRAFVDESVVALEAARKHPRLK